MCCAVTMASPIMSPPQSLSIYNRKSVWNQGRVEGPTLECTAHSALSHFKGIIESEV